MPSESEKKTLPKLPPLSGDVVKTLIEEPKQEQKEKKEKKEKIMKTLYISTEANKLLIYLYAEGEGKQNEIFEKAIKLYWALKKALPPDKFRRLVKLAEKEEIDKIKNRLQF